MPALMPFSPRSRLACVLAVVLAMSVVIGSSATSVAGGRPRWIVRCGFVRYRRVDPIVYPGVRDVSHLHAVFGNKHVTADPTYWSLPRAPPSCRPRARRPAFLI